MILPNVPPYFVNPRLDTAMIQTLQLHLDAKLGWLTKAYAEAKIGVEASTKLTYPQIYKNNGSSEHYNISPDNKTPAYCFFEQNAPYNIDINNNEVTYFFSVIFWANLKILDAAKLFDFTSILIKDATDALRFFSTNIISVETRPENIFDNYTQITQELKQFLMNPYTAFKITFEITDSYSDDCNSTPINSCQQNVDRINSLPESVRECLLSIVCENNPMTKEKAITANPLGTQSAATLLTKNLNRVDTNTTVGGSTKFSPALENLDQIVINNTSNDMNVYPSLGDRFIGMNINEAITVVDGQSLKVFCFEAGTLTIL